MIPSKKIKDAIIKGSGIAEALHFGRKKSCLTSYLIWRYKLVFIYRWKYRRRISILYHPINFRNNVQHWLVLKIEQVSCSSKIWAIKKNVHRGIFLEHKPNFSLPVGIEATLQRHSRSIWGCLLKFWHLLEGLLEMPREQAQNHSS